MRNLQRFSIFENDQPMDEQVANSLKEIGNNPSKFFKMFRVFRLQICIAIFFLITCILAPYRIIYG